MSAMLFKVCLLLRWNCPSLWWYWRSDIICRMIASTIFCEFLLNIESKHPLATGQSKHSIGNSLTLSLPPLCWDLYTHFCSSSSTSATVFSSCFSSINTNASPVHFYNFDHFSQIEQLLSTSPNPALLIVSNQVRTIAVMLSMVKCINAYYVKNKMKTSLH